MPQNSVAVITGASGGLGREFVKLLKEEQSISEIWAVARAQNKLNQLIKDFGDKIKVFPHDLSKQEELFKFSSELEKARPCISYLINCAGYAKFCSYKDLNFADSLNMIALNAGGVTAMCLICLPYMPRGSHIINISSQSSFQPLPYLNLYAATKAYIKNYSRALHMELKARGISVTAVCPGWMDTELYDRAKIGSETTIEHYTGMVKPGKVARKALRDANRGSDLSVYSLYVKLSHLAAKLLPHKLVMKVWLWQQKMQ